MRELERNNPVRPSVTNKPLRSDRLTAAIEGGTSIWVARKQEKSRRRAQERRLRLESEAAQSRAAGVPAEEGEPTGAGLDARMREAAQRGLREFKELLATEGTRKSKRAPDSKRR